MDPISLLAHKMIPLFCDALIRLDDQAWDPLQAHAGKIICFHIEPFAPLNFKIEEHGMQPCEAQESANTTFSGSPAAFLTLLLAPEHLHKSLHIRGDMECAKAFYDAYHHLDIDWEGHLAKVTGGTLAHNLCEMFRRSQEWFTQTWEARQQDVSAYLQDEINLLPTKQECDMFNQQVDDLRHQTERLSTRLRLIEQHLVNKD